MSDTTFADAPATAPEIEVKQNAARDAASLMLIGETGVTLQNFAQAVDFAKWMAQSGHAIPKHLRGNVGACIAVLDMAQRWHFSPYLVARHCYLVNDILTLDGQLVHAIIERFANLQYRLRPRYEGEGNERICIITGQFKGELEPLEYKSPPIGKISPKNSPLWVTDPDQQLFYFSSRRWCRRYAPDILLGVYSTDDIQDGEPLRRHIGFENAKDVSPGLASRLRGPGAEGFIGENIIDDIEATMDMARDHRHAKKSKPATEPVPVVPDGDVVEAVTSPDDAGVAVKPPGTAPAPNEESDAHLSVSGASDEAAPGEGLANTSGPGAASSSKPKT
ncbi:MAG TPA: recombinase RecT [Bradyrhizobium sp.]|jgi:hypothetical protein